MENPPVVSLVVPSEAYRIDDWMQAAGRLGVEIAVATEAHHSLAEDMGAAMIPVDFEDPEGSALRIAASSLPIRAIIPIDDRGVPMAARAAALRGLAHNSVDAADTTRDKGRMRKRLQGVIDQPPFVLLEPHGAGGEALSVGLPLVVKPVGLSGSVGVIRVDERRRIDETVERVRNIAADRGASPDPLLVERYVPGAEVAVEGMVTDAHWETLAVFDKPEPLEGPYFPETHYVTPSRLPHEVLERIDLTCARAVRSLGIVRGPAHAELRVSTDRVVLLEIASRPIGGLCGRSLKFGLTDTPLEELLIRNALGIRVRGTRLSPGASGVSMIPVPTPGVFAGIEGIEVALEVDHVTGVEVNRLAGRLVAPLPDESTYLGFVFARAPTPGEVERALRTASEVLQVMIE